MKKFFVPASLMLAAMVILSGCVAAIGNRDAQPHGVTLGQQLIDLQRAKDAGVITQAEFQAQKAKLLGNK